jgi:hypothetical protein
LPSATSQHCQCQQQMAACCRTVMVGATVLAQVASVCWDVLLQQHLKLFTELAERTNRHHRRSCCVTPFQLQRMSAACCAQKKTGSHPQQGTSQLRTGACTDSFTSTECLLSAAHSDQPQLLSRLPPTSTTASHITTQQPHVGTRQANKPALQGMEEEPSSDAPFASASGLPAGEFSAASARALSGLEPARQCAQHGTATQERSSQQGHCPGVHWQSSAPLQPHLPSPGCGALSAARARALSGLEPAAGETCMGSSKAPLHRTNASAQLLTADTAELTACCSSSGWVGQPISWQLAVTAQVTHSTVPQFLGP